MIKNYGFQPPKITETHYTEGDGRLLGAVDINLLGNWEKCLPVYEPQSEKFETFGCTVWGLQNQVECLHKYIYGEEPNYDERYNYNLANINPPGQDPQITYETGRKYGFTQSLLPMTDTLAEFKTPRPMTDVYKVVGKGWTTRYFFDHDWVLTGTPNPEKLRTNLRKCPLGVSVTAWSLKDGVYVDEGQPNTHWCLLYKMDENYYYVFDSYDHSKKILPLSHRICYAKRIVLYKKDPNVINKSFLEILKGVVILLQSYVQLLSKNLGEIIGSIFKKRN